MENGFETDDSESESYEKGWLAGEVESLMRKADGPESPSVVLTMPDKTLKKYKRKVNCCIEAVYRKHSSAGVTMCDVMTAIEPYISAGFLATSIGDFIKSTLTEEVNSGKVSAEIILKRGENGKV